MLTQFQSISILDITINREARQRSELTGLPELAASIQDQGLINPIVIDENLVLIAGERRLTAVRDYLGWTHINAQTLADLSEDERQLIELEENIRREELPWKDHVRTILAYFEANRRLHGDDYTITRCAEELHSAHGTVSRQLQVARALADGVPLVVNAPQYSVARGVVERMANRKQGDFQTKLAGMFSSGKEEAASQGHQSDGAEQTYGEDQQADGIGQAVSANGSTKRTIHNQDIPLYNESFAGWLDTYSGSQFNFIHCDFPYGIGADSHKQGAAKQLGGYADSEDIYTSLLGDLDRAMGTVIAESAHLLFWYSAPNYTATIGILRSMGWTMNPTPLIWMKSDNTGVLPDPRRGPRQIYECALMGSRGDRFIVQPVANAFAAPKQTGVHMSQKNTDMLQHFFRMFVDDSTTMLDPTCGSASALIAGHKAGAKETVGLEIDPEFYQRACANWLRQTQGDDE